MATSASSSSAQPPVAWTFVGEDSSADAPTLSAQDLRASLEKGTDDVKLQVLRYVTTQTLNGNGYPTLLMPIIQFVLPSKDKRLKKMLHYFWEAVSKVDENGRLLETMILVCNAIRNDLQHPNEYIRGATLRFLQKIREPEILEPLVPSARACLEHRHSFVRKNAVFAIMQIYKQHEHLIPDAPEIIQTFLAAESDSTCKRNAFTMLIQTAPERAYDYFAQNVYDNVAGQDELMQLAVIELVRKEGVKAEGPTRSRYVRAVFELLNSTSNVVKYEAATTLTILTQNPAAVKAAASAFIELIIKESDNNVKLIVLDRVETLKNKHEHVLDDLAMEILRVLSTPDMDVRKKALGIALDMASGRNVEEIVLFLKKELGKTLDNSVEKNVEYRQLLIQSIHSCAINFSEVAANVVHVLMDFLGDSNNAAAVDVISFVREVVERFPDLRFNIVERLLSTFADIKSGKVFRGALWIVGEYGTSMKEMREIMHQIRDVLGEIPILASEQRLLDKAEAEAAAAEEASGQKLTNGSGSSQKKATSTTKVLADGTYATETVYSSSSTKDQLDSVKNTSKPPLRALILGGDFYTATVLAATLAKIVLRFGELSKDSKAVNALRAEAMLIMTSIIRVGQSQFVSAPIDEDSQERISTCLQSLASFQPKSAEEDEVRDMFLKDTQQAYSKMVAHDEQKAAEKRAKESKKAIVQPDDVVSFRMFKKANASDDAANEYDMAMSKATGSTDVDESLLSKLSRVVQLTGFSDPVYAEAYVNVHQFDINLDVLVVNQTTETLQNMSVEFATLGDLKLVERPLQYTLGPHSFQSIKATIKVSSTETVVIFGNIFYDGPATSDTRCVVLNDVHIDILDYINPAYCTESQFRSMWTEFEWENKVNVNTQIDDLRTYLKHIMSSTNMSCLTPDAALEGECGFLSANMYARSLFGEDALANLSIEKQEGVLTGHIRIRSKTQGIALSLGDKVSLAQKSAQPSNVISA